MSFHSSYEIQWVLPTRLTVSESGQFKSQKLSMAYWGLVSNAPNYSE